MSAGGGFSDLSTGGGSGSLPSVVNVGAIPGQLQGIARTVVSLAEVKASDLEHYLATALEYAPNASFQDAQDTQIRAAKRQLGLAFVGALEKLCSTNQPLEAERWARALRTQYLLGELELLQVDCLNQLAILYFARNQHKRALKAVKAALKLCNRLEQLGIMTAASAATRRAALHLNSSDTLARLKRHEEALHSANSALQLLEPLADTSVEAQMGSELRISAMHSVGIQRQNTGDMHGAASMLSQAMQLANAKLPSDHALRKTVKRNAKAVNRPEWDVSANAGQSSRPPKVLPAIKKPAASPPPAETDEEKTARLAAEVEAKAKQDAEAAAAAAKAEEERIAAEKAEAERLAAEKAEQERLEAEQAAAAAAKGESEESAAAAATEAKEAEAAAAAKAKAEEEAAAEAAAATEKAEAEAAAAKAKEEEEAAAAAAAAAKDKEEAEAAAAAVAAAEAAATAKAEEERLAAEKAEQERLAAEKAERERIAAEQAEKERLAREEEAKRLAAEAQKREDGGAGTPEKPGGRVRR